MSNAWPRPVSADLPASLLAGLAPAAGSRPAGAELTLFRSVATLDIAAALRAPGMGAIEWTAGLPAQSVGALLERAAHYQLYLNISTNAAAQFDLARPLADALAARGLLSMRAYADTELALHEAISNALMHGNLAVDSLGALSLAELSRFSSQMNSRLADPRHAERPLEITAGHEEGVTFVEIRDEGAGYDSAANAARHTTTAGGSPPSGRGMTLIADLTAGYEIFDGGRGIRLRLKP
ncbi:ATP-binding protein [Radicibacter daui]|uniref:ATP-binding protein n=1 Tax=Radicibacter daui TaxID=3064829 RepID=UPI004046E587